MGCSHKTAPFSIILAFWNTTPNVDEDLGTKYFNKDGKVYLWMSG